MVRPQLCVIALLDRDVVEAPHGAQDVHVQSVADDQAKLGEVVVRPVDAKLGLLVERGSLEAVRVDADPVRHRQVGLVRRSVHVLDPAQLRDDVPLLPVVLGPFVVGAGEEEHVVDRIDLARRHGFRDQHGRRVGEQRDLVLAPKVVLHGHERLGVTGRELEVRVFAEGLLGASESLFVVELVRLGERADPVVEKVGRDLFTVELGSRPDVSKVAASVEKDGRLFGTAVGFEGLAEVGLAVVVVADARVHRLDAQLLEQDLLARPDGRVALVAVFEKKIVSPLAERTSMSVRKPREKVRRGQACTHL